MNLLAISTNFGSPAIAAACSLMTANSGIAVYEWNKPMIEEAVQEAFTWGQVVEMRLAAVRDLGAGWDGPGSIAVTEDAIVAATRLLHAGFSNRPHSAPPAIVPGGDGSLSLEWRLSDTRLEVEIEADGNMSTWAQDRSSKWEAEEQGLKGKDLFLRWAPRLTADKFQIA